MTAKEFILGLPQKVNEEAIKDVRTNFQFDIEGSGQYTVEVSENGIEAKEGFHGEPKCKISAKEDNLLGILKGDINPMMAVLTGKIKISNQGEMLKYAKMFGLM